MEEDLNGNLCEDNNYQRFQFYVTSGYLKGFVADIVSSCKENFSLVSGLEGFLVILKKRLTKAKVASNSIKKENTYERTRIDGIPPTRIPV